MPQNYLRNGIEVQKIDLCERARNKLIEDPERYSFFQVLDTATSPKYPSPYHESPTPEAPQAKATPPEPLATPCTSSNSMGGGAGQMVAWEPPSNMGAYGSLGSAGGSAGLLGQGGLKFFESASPVVAPMSGTPSAVPAPGSARAVAAAPMGTPLAAESDAPPPAEKEPLNVPEPPPAQGTPAQGTPAQGTPAQGAEKDKPQALPPVESGRGRGRGRGRGGARGARGAGATISQYEIERNANIAANKHMLESLGLGGNNEVAPKKLKAKQQRQPPIYKVPQVRTHAVTHSATHTVTHAATHGVTLSLLLTGYAL